MRVYVDTNVMRYFSSAFRDRDLPIELQAKMVLSPVSALELMSQLCDESATQAFSAAQAMLNWLPEKLAVLDIPPVFIQLNVVGSADGGDASFQRLTTALSQCLYARSPERLRTASKELRNYLGRTKLADAQRQQGAVLGMRAALQREKRKTIGDEELRAGFLASIALRAGVGPNDPAVATFADKLDAYYQHQTVRLKRAIENPHMNLLSKKRQNDLFDAEQLIYLAVPDLCFLSTDRRGFFHLVTSQQDRIHVAEPAALTAFESAQEIVRRAVDE